MEQPSVLKPGQLWKNTDNALLLVAHDKGELHIVNIEANCWYCGKFDKKPNPNWKYVGMITDKGE